MRSDQRTRVVTLLVTEVRGSYDLEWYTGADLLRELLEAGHEGTLAGLAERDVVTWAEDWQLAELIP